MKPLNQKSYGSIPHLIGSRLGPGDHHAHSGQVSIATIKTRDKHDKVIIQEKLDGGNVGICKVNGNILAITRAGYLASSSQYKTHHAFEEYVRRNEKRFNELLHEGERICGEWLLTSVGTKYNLPHEPLVVFDLMIGIDRINYESFFERVTQFDFVTPRIISFDGPKSVEVIESVLDQSPHGPIDPVEGAVWRVERKGLVDFLVKYVRPTKQDGKYLDESPANGIPKEFEYLLPFLK